MLLVLENFDFKKINRNFMRFLKKIWKWLNGKKRNIGVTVLIGTTLVQAFFPTALSPEQYKALEMAALTLSGVGVAHAIKKK